MNKKLVRTRFDRSRRTVQLAIPPKASLTQQQFKDECDINRIVAQAQRGIAPSFMARGVAQYLDTTKMPPDLQSAYEVIEQAHDAFMSLPAALRRELDDDPRNLEHITREQIDKYRLGRDEDPESEAEGAPLASPAPQAPSAPRKTPAKAKTPPPEGGEE